MLSVFKRLWWPIAWPNIFFRAPTRAPTDGAALPHAQTGSTLHDVRLSDFSKNSACCPSAPNPQSTIEIIDEWITSFPDYTGIKTNGYANLFNDERVAWGIERLGGVKDANILELGPLEGAHTYMLDQAGARSIIAIEAMKRSYLKCLITKELLGIRSASFLYGNFIPWLESGGHKFDIIWASGVLYHMTEPLRLLQLISEHTDRFFLWTHYYPDDFAPASPYQKPLVCVRSVDFKGRLIPHFDRSYLGGQDTSAYCGGVYSGSSWLRRGDILAVIDMLGFHKVDILDYTGVHGPSMSVAAQRV